MSDSDDFDMDEEMYDEDEEYEDFDQEDDQHFQPVIVDKEHMAKKSYEVDFKVYSTQDILSFQDKETEHVAGILGCRKEHAATLLRFFKWNKELLVEKYMDQPERTCQAAGVILDSQLYPKKRVVPGFMCDICCNDEPGLESIALSCGHAFCVDCYTHYVTQKICQEGESRSITCPDKCTVIVDEKTVELLVDSKTLQKYQHLLLRTYVDDSSYIRWCPAPGCEYAVECFIKSTQLHQIIPTVKCKCDWMFCFGCGVQDHQPSPCEVTKLWLKKSMDDSETANWMSANTKECVKCFSTIEKNGGCNHMTCKKCKHEFCWVCLGPWSEHGTQYYQCNRFDEKAGVEARDAQAKSRRALERYLHYYNRYANHENSAKLDKDLFSKTEKKMEQVQQSSELSWIEVQFLKKAVQVLLQARSTLKWTYCFAYYLERNNQTELFEDNQRDLEMAVEHLSELLEKPIVPEHIQALKQDVMNKSVYVTSRRQVLLEDTCKGLKEGRWKYNVTVNGVAPDIKE